MKDAKPILLVLLTVIPITIYCSDWYVRPLGGVYGEENGTSYENAFNGFTDIVWGDGGVTAGDTLWVCGTHANQLSVGASGSAVAGNIVIDFGYTLDPGIIDGVSAYAVIKLIDRSYVTVQNGRVLNYTPSSGMAAGLYVSRTSDSAIGNILIQDMAFDGGSDGMVGVYVDGGSYLTTYIDGVTIQGCATTGHSRMGIWVVNVVKNITIDDCHSIYDAESGPYWGILIGGYAGQYFDGWSVYSGDTYSHSCTFSQVVDVYAWGYGKLVNNQSGQDALSDGEYYFDTDGDALYVNLGGGNPNSNGIVCPVRVYAENCVISNSSVKYTQTTYPGEGAGVGFDRGVKNSSIRNSEACYNTGPGIIALCSTDSEITNCTSSFNGASGFVNNNATNVNYGRCFSSGNSANGFYSTSPGTENDYANCIAINNNDDGFKLYGSGDVIGSDALYNNQGFNFYGDFILTDSISYGSIGNDIVIAVDKTVTALNNCAGDSGKSGSGVYSDSGLTTLWSTDPLFSPSSYYLQFTSPAKAASSTGSYIGAFPVQPSLTGSMTGVCQ